MKRLLVYISLILILTSCFEEDKRVAPHLPGDLTVGTVELTQNYKYQVFFNLVDNETVKNNLISEWDLGFETSDSGWHVILNTSKMMLAGNSVNTNFEEVKSSSGLFMTYDKSDGNLDSTAIGNWYNWSDENPESKNYVYVIDRGTDESSNLTGKKKIVFGFDDENNYTLRFADLNGNNEQAAVIVKDTTKNFVCFSFESGVVDIEPNKANWDLLFTKYSTLLYTNDGDPYPYLVTGVLLNPYRVEAVRDSVNAFDEISLEKAENLILSPQMDIIGYEWKEYDFDNSMYTVLPEKIYVIKDTQGYYYKLRFIDYYNSTGEQGYPMFEFLRL